MRPVAVERGGSRGGSTVGSRALGVVEHGRRPDTEAGLDDGCAQRRHWGRSATKHGGGGGGGVEAKEKVARQPHGRIFPCKKKKQIIIEVITLL
jgi:hypothetical protein